MNDHLDAIDAARARIAELERERDEARANFDRHVEWASARLAERERDLAHMSTAWAEAADARDALEREVARLNGEVAITPTAKHQCTLCGDDCGECSALLAQQCAWLLTHRHG